MVAVAPSCVALLRQLYDEAGKEYGSDGDLENMIVGLRNGLQITGAKDEYGSLQEWRHAVLTAIYTELTELMDWWGAQGHEFLAARLQTLSKQSDIVISEYTYNELKGTNLEIEELGLVPLKGKSQEVRVFRVNVPPPPQVG